MKTRLAVCLLSLGPLASCQEKDQPAAAEMSEEKVLPGNERAAKAAANVRPALERDLAVASLHFGDPVFISAGRGDTVNETDLHTALIDGTLRAASLDVFITEPLPAGSPLWGLENVIITPHNAADSHPDAIVDAVVAEIQRFEAGEPLLNPVDRLRGY